MYRDFPQPRALREVAQFAGCPKCLLSPNRIADPAANTALRCPQTPTSEFADHKPAAGPSTRVISGIAFSASPTKQSRSRQPPDRRMHHRTASSRPAPRSVPLALHVRAAPTRGGDHLTVGIKCGYDGAMLNQFDGQCPIAATDIQQRSCRQPDRAVSESSWRSMASVI